MVVWQATVRRKARPGGPRSESASRPGGVAADDAPVAQLDRALDYGSKGWGFDSSRAHKDLVLREDTIEGGVPKRLNGADCKSAGLRPT